MSEGADKTRDATPAGPAAGGETSAPVAAAAPPPVPWARRNLPLLLAAGLIVSAIAVLATVVTVAALFWRRAPAPTPPPTPPAAAPATAQPAATPPPAAPATAMPATAIPAAATPPTPATAVTTPAAPLRPRPSPPLAPPAPGMAPPALSPAHASRPAAGLGLIDGLMPEGYPVDTGPRLDIGAPLTADKPMRLLLPSAGAALLRAAPLREEADRRRVKVFLGTVCDPELEASVGKGGEIQAKPGAGLSQAVCLVYEGTIGAIRVDDAGLDVTGLAREQLDAVVLDDVNVLWYRLLRVAASALAFQNGDGALVLGDSATARRLLYCLAVPDNRRAWVVRTPAASYGITITEVAGVGFRFQIPELDVQQLVDVCAQLREQASALRLRLLRLGVASTWDPVAEYRRIQRDYQARAEQVRQGQSVDETLDDHLREVRRPLTLLLRQCISVLQRADGGETDLRLASQELLTKTSPGLSLSPYAKDRAGYADLRRLFERGAYDDVLLQAISYPELTVEGLGHYLLSYECFATLCARADALGPRLARETDARLRQVEARLTAGQAAPTPDLSACQFVYQGQALIQVGPP